MGDPKRIALIAADLVTNLGKRVEAMDGKAMIASAKLKSVWLASSASFRLSRSARLDLCPPPMKPRR